MVASGKSTQNLPFEPSVYIIPYFCDYSYDVQDPEPDENGAPGQIYYKTSAATLIPIPTIDIPLPDYPVGKAVLARYPETTTFYRAEVTGVTRKGFCKLKFEDDQNQEMEVDRRFVLEWSQK